MVEVAELGLVNKSTPSVVYLKALRRLDMIQATLDLKTLMLYNASGCVIREFRSNNRRRDGSWWHPGLRSSTLLEEAPFLKVYGHDRL